jgi:pyrroline-5-carboxylate reductase
VAREADIIFLCVLPFQAEIVLKELRPILIERSVQQQKNKAHCKPIVVSTLAATGIPKLKLLAVPECLFVRTSVNVPLIRQDLEKEQSQKRMMRWNST